MQLVVHNHYFYLMNEIGALVNNINRFITLDEAEVDLLTKHLRVVRRR
jgi:hypothetical protein